MKKVEKLTQAQVDQFPRFVEEWTKIGLCTDPADRPRAEAAIKWMYAQANLAEPKIVWTGSPLSSGLTRMIVTSDKFKKYIGKKIEYTYYPEKIRQGGSTFKNFWLPCDVPFGIELLKELNITYPNWLGFHLTCANSKNLN